MSAMSQLVQGAEIFHGKRNPTLSFLRRPKIAGQTSGQALTSIIVLDKLLSAVMTATHAADPSSHKQKTK